MANIQITQLPAAGAITGTESVPIVQNGVTVKTTTGAIAASPALTATFLTKNQEPTLPNSRYLSTNTGITLVDGGAQSYYQVALTGAVSQLNALGGGIVVKNGAGTLVNRSIATSGSGLSVSNGDGTGGDPTLQLTGIAAGVAALGGTGLVAVVGGATVAGREITGTSNQIGVTAGNGSGNPTIYIVDNAVMPGTGSLTLPKGTTAQQPLGSAGQFRFNTDTQTFDGYASGQWNQFSLVGGVTSISGGSTGLTPATPTNGAVVLGGILNVSSGGTGASSLTGYVKGAGTTALTASSTIPTTDLSGTVTNAQIANPNVTFNGATVNLGASGTITAANPNALTFGTGFTAGTYTGATAQTINLANTAVTAGAYGSASNTLTATVDAQGRLTALASTPIAIANTQVSGLGTMSTQNASAVAISGGAINGTTVGSSTAAAGTFTSVAMTTGTITTLPTANTDIVNKEYADSIASGINFHQSCNLATTAALASCTYNNGASGVGATLTATANGALTVDSVLTVVNNRILVKNQVSGAQNGIYVVTQVGTAGTPFILTRATDYDTSGSGTNEIDQGDFVLILSGTSYANTSWVQQTPLPITVGTTAIVWVQFGAPLTYSAGTGLNESPSYTFNIANTGVAAASYGVAASVPTIAINAQGQITSASNTAIAIAASQVTSGTFSNAFLTNSAVTVNGTSISLGASGTITAANPNALTIGTGLTGTSYTGASAVTIALATSGVAAATYGSASQVPVFAVDTYGRLTSVTNTSIAIAAGAVSGLAASATTDTTNAANISSGTLPTGRISGSYTGITGVGTLTAGTWNGTAIGVAYGGTGLTATPTNGQVAIGNGTGYSLATLTAGTNVTISNTAGGITINATPSYGGSVTSVAVSGGTTGLTTSGGPITVAGTITLAGTLVVANGGTGATTLTGYVKGSGTSALTASTTIPSTDITGLGTMATQAASSVAITGGTIDGTSVGATTASTVRGTTITATTQFSGPGTGLTGTASSLSVGSATTATSATTTTNVAGGAAGSILYQSGVSATTALALGTTNYVLTAGASAPQYVAQSTLSVGSATSATTATNIAGGVANQIPYQTGVGATGFVTAPSVTSTFLQWNGTAFVWATAGSGTVTSVAVSGGTTGLTTSGGPITSSGTITLAGTLAAVNGGTGQSTYAVGDILYASTTSAVSKLTVGTTGQVLTSSGTVPQYVAQSTLAVGSATTASNLTGGAASQIPYQTGSGATSFIANGTAGQVLTSNGASAPTWSGIAGGTF